MAAKDRTCLRRSPLAALLGVWVRLLVAVIAVGAIPTAAHARTLAAPSAPENSPLGLAGNPALTRALAELLQARESPLESAFAYGQTAVDNAYATRGAATVPNRIYSARELIRRAAESGPFHNFPESFNKEIFERGTKTVTEGFFKQAKAGLSNDSVMYQLRGAVNGVEGTFEIGARPSVSGQTEVIMHRFFRPDP